MKNWSTMKYIRTLSIVGLLSGSAAVISAMSIGDTFGLPGSAAYRTYENFNRLMAILIALETCAFIALYLRQRNVFRRMGRIAALVVVVAWIGMAVGTAAEFWFFSDLPYGADNMRSVAFSIFSISSLIAGLVLLALGLWIFISRHASRSFGVLMMLCLPIDISLFVADRSIFLASALASIAIAILILRNSSPANDVSQEAA
jgi:hypothetical protein